MVKIPHIRIPSVRVGSIDPTSDIGTGGATPAPPTPITYLTQWEIVGNSEAHTLPYPDGIVLPNGYKRCKYIKSDGVAFMKFPFGFASTDEISVRAAIFNPSNRFDEYFISGTPWNSNNNRFAMGVNRRYNRSSDPIRFCVAFGSMGTDDTYLLPQTVFDTQPHDWTYKNRLFTMDNLSLDVSSVVFGSETTEVRLFYGYSSPTKSSIYDYKHIKGSTEYHLVPCLDNNDIPCLYDVVNHTGYYNSNTSGSFSYELYPQPTEIWSCGEYNPTDGKYHILVQPLGGSIADIALTEPLRKVNDVADSIEFPSDTEGKALVTRNLGSQDLGNYDYQMISAGSNYRALGMTILPNVKTVPINALANILCALYTTVSSSNTSAGVQGIALSSNGAVVVYDKNYNQSDSAAAFAIAMQGAELIYELATPTTELIDAPQIAEAESYTCEISQGGKAVEWSSFETDSE